MAKSSRPSKAQKHVRSAKTSRNQSTVRNRHCKPMLAVGASERPLQTCGIDGTLPNTPSDPGLLISSDSQTAADDFVAAIAKHRHFDRETYPPRV
jgi:catalase